MQREILRYRIRESERELLRYRTTDRQIERESKSKRERDTHSDTE